MAMTSGFWWFTRDLPVFEITPRTRPLPRHVQTFLDEQYIRQPHPD
jgi:hypothetical protein